MQVIRVATDSDREELVTLATACAFDNPLYTTNFGAAFVNSNQFFTFIGHMQRAVINDVLKRRYCMVAEQDHVIVAAAVVDPGVPEHSLRHHLLAGGWFRLLPALTHISLANLIKQLRLPAKQLQPLTAPHTWVLRRIMVNPMHRHERLAEQLLEDGVIPELKRLHVDTLLVTATTHDRRRFSTHNHFSVLKRSAIRLGAKLIDSWVLRRRIMPNL